jgi:SNF2 family DNA or RNA helicase
MTVHLTMARGRIELRSGWTPSIAEECKSVPGANWSKTKGAWTWPLTMPNLRALRNVFEDRLDVAPELWAWAKEERRKEKQLAGYQRVHDAKLMRVPAVAPRLAEAMGTRTYQRSAARFISLTGNVLLADEPGLGKTATALAAIIESDLWLGDHIVIAPKSSLSSVWARQIEMWTGAVAYAMPEGRPKREKTLKAFFEDPAPTKFLVVNPTMVRRLYGHYCPTCDIWKEDVEKKRTKRIIDRKTRRHKTITVVWPDEHHWENHKVKRSIQSQDWAEIIDYPWTSVIIDEAHDLFSAYRPANVTQATQGALDLGINAKRIALTGTPLRGSETKIWGTLNWLDPKSFSGYWNFIDLFFDVRETPFGREVVGVADGMQEELGRVLDKYVMRRTRLEVRGDLPKNQRYDVMVEMSDKHRKQYEEFRAWGEVELASGSVSGQGLLSEITRLQQMAYGMWTVGDSGKLTPTGESPKAEWLIEWLRVRGITGKPKTDFLPEEGSAYKHVVVSKSTEVLNDIERQLNAIGIKTLKIMGSVNQANRAKYQSIFQSTDTEYRVMLIQTQTGGVAIELDAWCDEGVILDETFVADDQKQVEGRWDNRSGRIAPRSFYYVRTAETIDQKIAEGNYRQQDLQHKLLDKRRGVEEALHLFRGE